MAKEFAKKFYNSRQWKACRESFIVSKLGICDKCGKPNANLVHHKIILNESNIDNPEIALNHDNLELHHRECHNIEHMSKHSPLEKGYRFDANGDLLYIPPVVL